MNPGLNPRLENGHDGFDNRCKGAITLFQPVRLVVEVFGLHNVTSMLLFAAEIQLKCNVQLTDKKLFK